MRTTALIVLLAASGCGSVCDTVAAAERQANSKALDCNLTNITVHDASTCNGGLQKCNSDDLTELNSYATCLNNLPVCTKATETQFNFSRLGCTLQPIGRITPTCANAILN